MPRDKRDTVQDVFGLDLSLDASLGAGVEHYLQGVDDYYIAVLEYKPFTKWEEIMQLKASTTVMSLVTRFEEEDDSPRKNVLHSPKSNTEATRVDALGNSSLLLMAACLEADYRISSGDADAVKEEGYIYAVQEVLACLADDMFDSYTDGNVQT